LTANCAVESLPYPVTVTVRKPNALPFAAAAGVTINRPYHARTQQDGFDVYIALGSNLGNRLETIERALSVFESHGIQVEDVSGLYESAPMYVEDQPQFLNAVCKVFIVAFITNQRHAHIYPHKISSPH
jgi:dihydroneopterin aldolase / 2-amino-4-hydroxy-6-hydroxymethyldihydropteridine diphosphokinase / dihydropteroate synthase